MKMEIKENMKMYDVLFGIDSDNLKVTFINEEGKPFSLSKAMMKQVYDYLNEPINLKIHLSAISENKDLLEEDKIQQKQEAINAMKKAVEKRNKRKISDEEIVRLKDEEGLSFYAIAKKAECCNQTVINAYNKMKNNNG